MELQGREPLSSLPWCGLRNSTQIFSPVGFASHHNLKDLGCFAGTSSCSAFWHLSVLCSQGIPVAGPTQQAAGPSKRSPGSCWKGLAQGRRYLPTIYGLSTDKLVKKVTLEKPSHVEKNKDRKHICEQSSFFVRVTQWLSSNESCSEVISTEEDKPSCFCLLSLTDFVKNTLFQNAGCLTYLQINKEKCQKRIFQLFWCWFYFFSLRFWNYKTFIHEVKIKCHMCG